MKHLILLRHGQSEWNLENRFTGWTDVDLSEKGRDEAKKAGELIAKSGILPRYCFTSYLKRAIQTETANKFGDEQVHIWRRSYDVAPPALTEDDERFPASDVRYAALAKESLPLTESLENTIYRVRPCWEELIVPALNLYDDVIIAAHGNSLRALVMMLNKLTPEQIVSEEIPTGAPRVFTLDDRMGVVDDKYL